MEVRIRNFVGVESADLPLARIALIGGLNGAGKTTVLDAVACAVLGMHSARGVDTKKGAAQLVRDGAPAGSVTLRWDGGEQRVGWPDADVTSKGAPRALGTALGIGARRWMEVPAKERAAEMAERLKLKPTLEHLAKFLADKGVEKQETIEAVWALIDDQGWDAAHKKAREQVTKLRGRWEQVTAQGFGSQKAAKWRPNLLDEAETYTVEAADADVADARAAVEALLVAGAVDAADIKRARDAASDLGPAQAREKAVRQKMTEADTAAERLRADLAKLPVLDAAVHTFPCPHCEQPVWVKRQAPTDPIRLVKPPAEISADELKRNRAERAALEKAIDQLQRALDAATDAAAKEVAAVRAAEAATERLAALEAIPKADEEALTEARGKQALAESVRDAVKDWIDATAIFQEWQRSQPIIEALAPEGVRAARVAKAIGQFNEKLAELSAAAEFGAVAVGPDTDAMLAGRAYGLLSESERWRVDFTITLALAEMEKPAVILVDRLDVLHPQARPGVFMALNKLGIPSVVGVTAKDASTLPPLDKAKPPGSDQPYGRTYWLKDGRLSPVA